MADAQRDMPLASSANNKQQNTHSPQSPKHKGFVAACPPQPQRGMSSSPAGICLHTLLPKEA